MTKDGSAAAPPSRAVRLRREEAALRARLLPVLREASLAMEHWRIIAVIADSPGVGMTSVASAAVVPSATLTRHVDLLVQRGVVVRRVDRADRRRVVLGLSARGHDLAARLREAEGDPDPPELS